MICPYRYVYMRCKDVCLYYVNTNQRGHSCKPWTGCQDGYNSDSYLNMCGATFGNNLQLIWQCDYITHFLNNRNIFLYCLSVLGCWNSDENELKNNLRHWHIAINDRICLCSIIHFILVSLYLSVRLSVRLSLRPSVDGIVSVLYLR